MIVVGMTINRAKSAFFDRKAVIDAMDKITHDALRHFGGEVRKVARRSIKDPPMSARGMARRGYGTFFGQPRSRPGNPPFNQAGHLKKFLFFAYEFSKRSVVIGPMRLSKRSNTAPHALEYGGPSRSATGQTVRIRKRPFMQPAFVHGQGKLPQIWENARIKAAA